MDCSLPDRNPPVGVDCHAPLQGIFPTQGSNPGLQHCRQILYHLSQHPYSKVVETRFFSSKGTSWKGRVGLKSTHVNMEVR